MIKKKRIDVVTHIPVLTQKRIPLIPPVQAGAAVAELAKGDLRTDIQRDNVEDIALGTVCDACNSNRSASDKQTDMICVYV